MTGLIIKGIICIGWAIFWLSFATFKKSKKTSHEHKESKAIK